MTVNRKSPSICTFKFVFYYYKQEVTFHMHLSRESGVPVDDVGLSVQVPCHQYKGPVRTV